MFYVIIGDKIIKTNKEEYEKIINEKPNTSFINECIEISKLFNKQQEE